jgi:hypothetical protein
MSVSFIDPSGKTLVSTSEPLDFSCTTTPIAISIGFGSVRPEERVYRDGAFLPGYRRSTASAGVFSIVRDQEWPANPQLYVDEPTLPPVGGQTMGAIYEVDLTAQPSQPLMAAGSYVIDGKTWWAKGGLGSQGARTEVINGSGLRLYWPQGVNFPGDYSSWRSGYPSITPIKRTLLMPLSQIAGYNPQAALAILWRFSSNRSLSASIDGAGNYGGVMDAALNSADILRAEHQTQMSVSRVQQTGSWWTSNENGDTRNPGGAGTAVQADHVQGVYRFLADRWYPLLGPWTGSLTVPDNYVSEITLTGDMVMRNRCSASPCFLFAFEHTNGGSGMTDTYLTHLKILQPKV